MEVLGYAPGCSSAMVVCTARWILTLDESHSPSLSWQLASVAANLTWLELDILDGMLCKQQKGWCACDCRT